MRNSERGLGRSGRATCRYRPPPETFWHCCSRARPPVYLKPMQQTQNRVLTGYASQCVHMCPMCPLMCTLILTNYMNTTAGRQRHQWHHVPRRAPPKTYVPFNSTNHSWHVYLQPSQAKPKRLQAQAALPSAGTPALHRVPQLVQQGLDLLPARTRAPPAPSRVRTRARARGPTSTRGSHARGPLWVVQRGGGWHDGA